MTQSSIARLGPVMQIAFVPEDFDAALKYWTGTMGAGPFFVIPNARMDTAHYHTTPTDPVLTVALGYWGDMQIELIRQDNDAPSPYRDWRAQGGRGVHHVCIAVDDLAAARQHCIHAGAHIIFSGSLGETAWFYADTGHEAGTIIEVIHHAPSSHQLITMIRDAARDWDGREAVRYLG